MKFAIRRERKVWHSNTVEVDRSHGLTGGAGGRTRMSDPLFVVLNQGDHPPVEWFRQYKANVARLRTGDRERIAEVVKF
jgi:hypothetical protein